MNTVDVKPSSEFVQEIETSKLSSEESKFMNELLLLGIQLIGEDAELKAINGAKIEEMKTFLTLLQTGYAEKSGSDQECRSICVAAQGSLEEALARMLKSGEVVEVKQIFLTPLPCTPLRKEKGSPINTPEPFESTRLYTLDKREYTVRALRDQGAETIVSYLYDSYDKLKKNEDPISKQEVATYEKEKQMPYMREVILKENPGTLVGALYLITDKYGYKYYLATQGVQAQDAKPAIWKKWFCPARLNNHEGSKRSKEMLDFIKNHTVGSVEIIF